MNVYDMTTNCYTTSTCQPCIDKSHSVKLSQEINVMFRYYQNAGKCYVYLSDVFLNH